MQILQAIHSWWKNDCYLWAFLKNVTYQYHTQKQYRPRHHMVGLTDIFADNCHHPFWQIMATCTNIIIANHWIGTTQRSTPLNTQNDITGIIDCQLVFDYRRFISCYIETSKISCIKWKLELIQHVTIVMYGTISVKY